VAKKSEACVPCPYSIYTDEPPSATSAQPVPHLANASKSLASRVLAEAGERTKATHVATSARQQAVQRAHEKSHVDNPHLEESTSKILERFAACIASPSTG